MTSRRAKLHEDTNFRLMKILEANPDLSQRQMGKLLGLSCPTSASVRQKWVLD